MKKVKIHIVSKAKNGEEITCFEQWVDGKMTIKDGKYYAFYDEPGEGMEGVKTSLKWDDNTVVLSRSGTIENRQEFRTGYTCVSVYKTPYLQIPLSVVGNFVRIYCEKGKYVLFVEYSIIQDDRPYGNFEIQVELEEVH